jgi:outer membrane protein assembly factor BamB
MIWRSASLALSLLTALLLTRAPAPPAGAAEGDKAAKRREVPMFGGSPARNMANTAEKDVLADFAVRPKKERNVKWSVALGTKAFGGPVIAGGRIFVGTNNDRPRDPKVKGLRGVLMCFRESDGKFLWQITHEPIDEENDTTTHANGEGVVSTPCVDGDRVYYVSNRCELVCADVKGDEKTGQGKVLWTYDMIKELDVFPGQHSTSSPLVVGDLVYALTSNGVNAKTLKLPKPNAPALVAVNKKTGKLAWSDNRPGAGVMRGQWSNPAAATVGGVTQIIYAGGDGWLYALEAKKGGLLWKFDCNPKSARKQPYRYLRKGAVAFVIGTPVIHDNRCYIATGREPDEGTGPGHLWCIDVTRKPAKDDKDLTPVARTVTVKEKEDGKEVVKTYEELDPKDAANKASGLVWHYGGPLRADRRTKEDGEREYVFGWTMSTVAVHGGLVYAAEKRGDLHVLDAKTGKRYWMHDPEEGSWCSPYYVDGKVFYGTEAGELYVFKAGKDANKPKNITIGPPVHVPPVACNGVLYVNSGTHLYAIAKPRP